MPHIKVLPVDLRNKIAAGEVIERPASVVKELIENAIDAGSTEITVDILHGGKRLIRVADNGSGMDPQDARLCLEPHATSKLASEEDLFRITTMGFRGEALPSIASVSKVLLRTGLQGTPSGCSIEIQGGQAGEVKDAPGTGTTVEVRDLFYNTPARKKFMKADATELSHIIDTVTRAALGHPGIGFGVNADRKEALSLPRAGTLRERIMQIYGEELTIALIETSAEGPAGITAFVSRPEFHRNSKSHQFIFINSRPVRDAALAHAVYRAYEGLIPPGRHPIFFLFISIDPRMVDFNVHPTKREVRFAEKDLLYRFVGGVIRETGRGDRDAASRRFSEPAAASTLAGGAPLSYEHPPAAFGAAEEAHIPYRPSLPHIYLGDTFIALAGKGGLTLIDHHAAHERILYERFLNKVNLHPQHLLFPRQVQLSRQEHDIILRNRDTLLEFGLEVDDFGRNTVVVRSLPEALGGGDLRGILADAAAAIREGDHPGRPLRESLAARLACHSSVRGKGILNSEEVSQLLADLGAAEYPDQCPHGRPTRIFLSLDDLRKMFRRI